MTIYTASDLPASLLRQSNRSPIQSQRSTQKEDLRHLLLGSPSAIRQVIHQLHSLHYVEPTLWSPVTPVGERLIITPEQGEFISLLRRSL
ncbi:MAG: hypothetical protein AAF716_03005 [Cyanobacteria bacterium P01_D01_bin.1]